jgi:truncated hemoglobin YjbI
MGAAGLTLALVVGLLLIGWVWLYTRRPTPETPRREPEPTSGVPGDELRAGNGVLTPPPIVTTRSFGDVTLREWLTRFHPKRDGVWDEVVTEFYARAARDVRIASYFADVDMAKLQRHFLATLLIVTGRGLTVSAVESMRDKHATVHDLDGDPITGEIYDRVVTTLGQVIAEALVEAGVDSAPVLDQLLTTVAPLRSAIVRPRVGEA